MDKQVSLEKFDYTWLSFEMGCIKPDETIYELVEKDCQIKPNHILFIDDTERNLIVAKQRGWNVCLAKGYEFDKIENEIQKFLQA